MLLCRLRSKKRGPSKSRDEGGDARDASQVPSWSPAFSSQLARRQEEAVTTFISRLQQAVLARARAVAGLDQPSTGAPQPEAAAVAPPRVLAPVELLDHNTLSLVFGHLLPRDLARCKVVCREWAVVASNADMLRAMVRAWELRHLTGQPRCWSMVERTTIQHFVHKHVVCKSDSMAGLAVRFGTDMATLRRYNNMTSEHALQSRTHLYVPVSSPRDVVGRSAVFVYDELSCREFVQLLPPEEAAAAQPAGGQDPGADGEAADGQQGQEDKAAGNALAEQERLKRMARIMARSLRVDDATATYYLEEAGGDMRKAMRLAEQDAGWDVATVQEPSRSWSGGRRSR